MATHEDDEDSIINPFTMLLTHTENDDRVTSLHHPAPNQNHILRSIQSTVIIRQLPTEGLSFQLWPAATTLVSLLDRLRVDPPNSPLFTVLSDGPLRILELGSGTGIVGIVAAATLGANVTVTDLPHVVPNLRFNAEANRNVVGSSGGAVTVAPLRWGHADDVEAIGRDFDVIMASDVVYHDHLYEPLLETLRLMMEGKKMVFVMAHMRRWKKESVFFKKAKKHFNVDVLYTDTPSNGSRVGVIVYRFVNKVKFQNRVPHRE
ncbi:hypothetical protein RJT34_30438 [Clitoria ternatea]|uniref:Uncharacterized protein n=1 Tax=Clitoria ternatea TaxID=43366 RepID=A0AAN9ESS1_CLITE